MTDQVRTRPPRVTYERIKLALLIVSYVVLAEYVDPRPFYATTLAKVLYVVLVAEVIRQFIAYRLEVSTGAVVKAQGYRERWEQAKRRFSSDARFRMRRVLFVALGVYSFGWLVDMLTTRCTGALQCALLFPRIAIENLPTALQIAFYIAIGLMQMGAMFYAMTKVGFVKLVMPGTIQETFDDVYGQDAAKAKVMEQIRLLEDSQQVEDDGGYMPKGILLWGPPGTGKTMLAKAAANASTKPLILVPPGAFASTFVGINFLKVWMLFRMIRKISVRHGGVIVFIDEIDSLGNRGGEVEQEARKPADLSCVPIEPDDPAQVIVTGGGGMNMGTLEAFLAAMDGLEEPRGFINRVIVFLGFKPLPPPEYKYMMMGATNMLSKLDPALLRAGRFGRKIHVTYPKVEGRRRTYEGYLGKVNHSLTDEQIDWAARNHARGTGAEIKDIVNEALLTTYRDDRPEEEQGVITFEDLMQAMLWVKYGESDGPFEREAGKWAVAVHEAGHAVVFHHLNRDRMLIWIATIEQHGRTGGMVAPTATREDWLLMRSEMVADIAVSLGSRVAEELVLGEPSNGHGGDGKAATERAAQMVRLGATFGGGPDNYWGQLGNHDWDREEFRQLVEAVLRSGYEKAREVLVPRVNQIEAVAQLLVDKGTVEGDAIHRLLDEMEAA